MALTFEQIAATIPQYVARGALTQLNIQSVFAKAAIGDYENISAQKGQTITLRKPRIVEIEDYDPRSADPAKSEDPGFTTAQLTLERLFTAGFPVFGTDLAITGVEGYVKEYADQISAGIGGKFDDYLYNKFRTLSIATSGTVSYAAAAPVSMVAAVDGDEFVDFNKTLLSNADTVLDNNSVPSNNRYAIISSAAKGAFLGDAVLVEGFAATAAGSAAQLMGGLPIGTFVPRYNFMVGGSNIVGKQTGNGSIEIAITAATDDVTLFMAGDYAEETPLGAVRLTAASTAGLAAGKIVRIGTSSTTVAFGLLLRVESTYVWLVPYSPKGVKLVAAQIPSSQNIYLPTIPSVSVGFHREALVFGTRPLGGPTPGSGATVATVSDPNTGLSLQILKGSYDVNRFKESQRVSMLCGATLTDYRKAVLMLSL